MLSIDFKDMMQLLLYTVQVQNTMIGELSLKIKRINENVKVQRKIIALESDPLKEKCKHFQRRDEVTEDNPPRDVKFNFDQFQCTLDALHKENEILKGHIKNIYNQIYDLKFKLRFDDANKVQQAHTNSKTTIENNIGYVSTTRTTPNNPKLKFTCLDTSKNDVTCTTTKENREQVISELTGQSELRAFHVKRIGTVKSTVNDIKINQLENNMKKLEYDPISALNELCMSCKWMLPNYEFFKEGDNKTFTYSAKCTVLMNTVRVEGLIKKEAKRTVAMLMYNKIINLINRHVSPEENWGEKNQ